jgi:hypothetical protein
MAHVKQTKKYIYTVKEVTNIDLENKGQMEIRQEYTCGGTKMIKVAKRILK